MSERERGDCAATTISLQRGSGMNPTGRPSPAADGADDFISVRDVARRTSMSERIIRSHIRGGTLPHYRNCKRGKIWLRWTEFAAWMERRRIGLKGDDSLLGVIRDMNRIARTV